MAWKDSEGKSKGEPRMSNVLENSVQLTFEYDADDDVLYGWVGEKARPAITYESDDGSLIRLDPVTNEFVGVTVFDYKARWEGKPITLSWEVEVRRPAPRRWLAARKTARVTKQRVLRDHLVSA